ncbi:restriction of telomere capping protein 5 [Monosporozyma unispora]|nr:Restriction of telomere capping protein 5 [Kazachstania unispora]
MGQTTSTETSITAGSQLQFLSRDDMRLFYDNKAMKQFTTLELFSFKHKIGKDDFLETVSDESIIQWLQVPTNNGPLIQIILNMIRLYSNFPFVNSSFEDITGVGLLKTILLLDKERCHKFIGNKTYDQLTLLFISLALNESNVSKNEDTSIKAEKDTTSDEKFSYNNIIKDYDNVSLQDLTVDNRIILQFIQWVLVLWHNVPRENSTVDSKDLSDTWSKYKTMSTNILRTMNCYDMDNHNTITHDEFVNVILTFLPNFLIPLSNIFKHLLYKEAELQDHSLFKINFDDTKLMTKELMSTLTLMIPPTHFPITKIQKLYVGRESGFSMRSLQSKVFRWLAPSILLVSGMRIVDDLEYGQNKNPRYTKFLDEYKKLKDEDQNINESLLKKRKVIFAICIKEPWRVTNKEQFGGEGTTIYQLSPWIDVYKAKKPNVIYFNTIGGGIGIGNEQPILNSKSKKYKPGNVSLTLDNSLEFGVFRHVGYGGSINPGLLDTVHKEESESSRQSFELKFLIQDVEVWGCGGEKELAEQLKQLEWEEAEAKRRQQVNLKSLGEDRALLEMAGLVGQHQSGGSM